MVRQFFKKKSKRITTRKRTKIERKVREHNRKTKKKGQGTSSKTKTFTVPNSFPLKEQVLREAENYKKRVEEEREKQKIKRKKDRQKLMDKKRNLGNLVKDAQKRTADYERKQAFVSEKSKEFGKGSKTVENSLKAYYKEFKKVVEAADVVIEVLDARDPLGSRCPQVEEAVLSAGPNKRLILLLNKVDLVPRDNVEKWLTHLRNEFPTIAFKASTQNQSDHLSQSKVPVTLASEDLRKSSRCLGADVLMKLLGNYCRNRDIRTAISVGVVGFPNTGKSSVINSLKRAKACSVGATPGVTKSMQQVQIDKHVKLLDSPGIVMATGTSDASTILKNCVKVETIEDPVVPVSAILRRCNKHQMMLQYNVPDFSDVNEFLSHLSRRLGKLKKGGIPDVIKAARTVIQDWNVGKITYYTHPPESNTKSSMLSAEIVSEMSKEFDIDSLAKDEETTLQGLKTAGADDIVIVSSGPTEGRIDDTGEDDEDMEDDSDDGSSEEEEEDDDEEKMEQSDEEVKNTTVTVKPTRSRGSSTSVSTGADKKKKMPAQKPSKADGNQQLNKARKQAFKAMKKDRKRSDVLAGQLSEAMEGALGSLGGSSTTAGISDDDYNFEEDYH